MAQGGAGCYHTAVTGRCSVFAQGQITSIESPGRSARVPRQRGESWGQAAAGEGGEGGVGMLLQTAVPGAGYLVHSPPLEREQDTLRLRDSSTQHVRDKQFIFLPQLLTEGNIRCH